MSDPVEDAVRQMLGKPPSGEPKAAQPIVAAPKTHEPFIEGLREGGELVLAAFLFSFVGISLGFKFGIPVIAVGTIAGTVSCQFTYGRSPLPAPRKRLLLLAGFVAGLLPFLLFNVVYSLGLYGRP